MKLSVHKVPPALVKTPKSIQLAACDALIKSFKDLLVEGITLFSEDAEDAIDIYKFKEWRRKVCKELGIDHDEFFPSQD